MREPEKQALINKEKIVSGAKIIQICVCPPLLTKIIETLYPLSPPYSHVFGLVGGLVISYWLPPTIRQISFGRWLMFIGLGVLFFLGYNYLPTILFDNPPAWFLK
jgi:hypothetical protein